MEALTEVSLSGLSGLRLMPLPELTMLEQTHAVLAALRRIISLAAQLFVAMSANRIEASWICIEPTVLAAAEEAITPALSVPFSTLVAGIVMFPKLPPAICVLVIVLLTILAALTVWF